jgi:ADP-ribose pyrophosphatase YjhB (NUDIX family)
MLNSWADVLKSSNLYVDSKRKSLAENKLVDSQNVKDTKTTVGTASSAPTVNDSKKISQPQLTRKISGVAIEPSQLVLQAKTYDMLPSRFVVSTTINLPISESFGLIPYDPVENKCLLVRRKYNPAFLTLLRGNYRDSELAQLLGSLGTKEVEIIKLMVASSENISNFHSIFFKSLKHVDYCKTRFASHNMIKLTEKLKGSGDGEWLFPSGRPQNDEDPIDTAIREFCEETGALKQEIKLNGVIKTPLIERIDTISKVHIRYYYPYITNTSITIRNGVDEKEIEEISWMTEKESLLVLSSQRVRIFQQCQKIISQYLK